jgi:hypothetical protein
MRILSMLSLLASLVVYVLAIFVKLGVIHSLLGIRPVTLLGIIMVNALIAIAAGILSIEKK